MLKSFFTILLLLPAAVFAQVTITGKVRNKANNAGIPAASVFLSNASVGNTTAADGTFELTNVKNGQYELVVSCVGYESTRQTVLINGAAVAVPVIELIPKVTQLREVKVNANRDRYIRLFTNQFLGQSENASQCKILNPEELDFQYAVATGRLKATTDDFLIIENRALGYRIKYLLHSFDYDPGPGMLTYTGESVFEELTGSNSDLKRWQKKRAQTYLGSDMHFLRSCLSNSVSEEHFSVRRLIRTPNKKRPADSLIREKLGFFRSASANNVVGATDSLQYWSDKAQLPSYTQVLVKTPLTVTDYLRRTELKGIFAIGLKDCLQINYKNGDPSVMIFKQPYAFFDQNGIIHNPESNLVEGYWAGMRIANLLPVDYELK